MKLNLGCGPVRVDGYLSVDIREDCKPDIVADVAHLDMIDTGSVDAIYASHLLEHFAHDDPVLEEWHRVLVPGGEILVIVPDFMHMYELYIAGAFTLDFFTSIFYGAKDYPPEYQHKQVFTPAMLITAMQPLFRDAAIQFDSCVRVAYIGETMALGHKL